MSVARRQKPRPCRTCKIRKVKCDEIFPICRRCESTGRNCDGYGIWGGGGRPETSRGGTSTSTSTSASASTSPMPKLSIPMALTPLSRITPEEQVYLEWFRGKSVAKLPGVFGSRFWDTLAFQAGTVDPAVFHSIVALGAVHKSEVLREGDRSSVVQLHDEQEDFIQRQLSKVVNCLQLSANSDNKESLRIALISCLVFVSLEFLRGHYQIGSIHLQNGLKLANSTFTSVLWLEYDAVDQCIMEAFVRLQLQVQMFGQKVFQKYTIKQNPAFEFPMANFRSLEQSRRHLDYMLKEIIQLSTHAALIVDKPPADELLSTQLRIQAELDMWFEVLSASLADFHLETNPTSAFAYKFLMLYHKMSSIMVQTCLHTAHESVYQKFTGDFVFLLSQAVDIRVALALDINNRLASFPGSISDIGWIPPLFYTALKCRNHRVRIHAVRLLASTRHREGVWDSRIAGFVAQKVVDIEERDFYTGFGLNNNFPTAELPSVEELSVLTPPDPYLIKEVEVMLSDNNAEKISLVYKQRDDYGNWEDVLAEFDVPRSN